MIKDYILTQRIALHTDRIARLADLNAPDVVMDRERHLLAQARAGVIGKIDALDKADPEALLAMDYTAVRWDTGRGGKSYATFTTASGDVRYFPQGRFGPFLAVGAA